MLFLKSFGGQRAMLVQSYLLDFYFDNNFENRYNFGMASILDTTSHILNL